MYPIIYSAEYEGEGRSRLSAFFRYFLAIPWIIVAMFYGLAALVATIIAWFAIVFTARYPQGLYDFNAGFARFYARVNSFSYLLTDSFPPFNGQSDDTYPVRIGIAPPLREYSRLKTLFRLIVGIPVMLLNYVMGVIVGIVGIIAWFALVIVARLPEGIYTPIRAALAYQTKAGAYFLLLTEDYPPFWTEEDEERAQLQAPSAAPGISAPAPEAAGESNQPPSAQTPSA
jgi:hypothetical protein